MNPQNDQTLISKHILSRESTNHQLSPTNNYIRVYPLQIYEFI